MPLLTFLLLCQIMAVMGDYTYAPVPNSLDGSPSLACVGISYNTPDNDYVTADRCKQAAEEVAKFYLTNSRGLLKLQPAGYHMKYDGSRFDFGKAELIAKKTFKAQKYIIPTLHRKCCNHASNDIAHMIQFTGWVMNHEVGHLLGFQHTGAFSVSKDGKVSYNQYGDRDSVMGGGGTGSKYLSPPQYYLKGWLRKEEAALYQTGTVFELKQITKLDGKKGLAVVLIPNKLLSKSVPAAGWAKGRDAFVAFPKTCKTGKCFALYFGGSGASSIIGSSSGEMYDSHFTGLHIKMVNVSKDTINVTIDFIPPSPAKLRELQQIVDEVEVEAPEVELNEYETEPVEPTEAPVREEL